MSNKLKGKKLTVTDVMRENNFVLKKGTINLVVSPVSSGKTYYIFEELLKDSDLSKVIYLCDTSNLKEAVRIDKCYSTKCKLFEYNDIYKMGNELAFHTSGKLKDNRVTVLTYSHLGQLLEKFPNILDNIDTIICDEAHNLIKYSNRFDNAKTVDTPYYKVIEKLKEIRHEKLVAMFTATQKKILSSPKINDISFTLYDFSNHSHIKCLKEKNTFFYNNYRNLAHQLCCYNGFQYDNKCVIYIYSIRTINTLINMLSDKGLSVCGLWSTHNEKYPMTEQQLLVRKSILEDGIIPDNIDVLIINASYETGININDKRIDLVIIYSTSKDTQIQARGRVRKDITNLYLLHNSVYTQISIKLDDKWLERPLTKIDKDMLAKELSIYDSKGRLVKWNNLVTHLINNGYTIEPGSKIYKEYLDIPKKRYTTHLIFETEN